MKRAIAIGVLTLIFHSAASAQGAGTAQDLYDRCARNDPMCAPFLLGVAAVMALMGKVYQDQRFEYKFVAPLSVFAICSTGSPVTGYTLPHVFMAWLDRHPERKQDSIGSSAMDAFSEAWPCGNPN
jgi:Rap1a immunity proteins